MQFSDNFLHIAVHNFFQQFMYTIFIPQSRMTQPIVSKKCFWIYFSGRCNDFFNLYICSCHSHWKLCGLKGVASNNSQVKRTKIYYFFTTWNDFIIANNHLKIGFNPLPIIYKIGTFYSHKIFWMIAYFLVWCFLEKKMFLTVYLVNYDFWLHVQSN